MKKSKMCVYPIVLDTFFGLSVQDQEVIKKQDWFVSFSDFFGNPAVWVLKSSYNQALQFFKSHDVDILCV